MKLDIHEDSWNGATWSKGNPAWGEEGTELGKNNILNSPHTAKLQNVGSILLE